MSEPKIKKNLKRGNRIQGVEQKESVSDELKEIATAGRKTNPKLEISFTHRFSGYRSFLFTTREKVPDPVEKPKPVDKPKSVEKPNERLS